MLLSSCSRINLAGPWSGENLFTQSHIKDMGGYYCFNEIIFISCPDNPPPCSSLQTFHHITLHPSRFSALLCVFLPSYVLILAKAWACFLQVKSLGFLIFSLTSLPLLPPHCPFAMWLLASGSHMLFSTNLQVELPTTETDPVGFSLDLVKLSLNFFWNPS